MENLPSNILLSGIYNSGATLHSFPISLHTDKTSPAAGCRLSVISFKTQKNADGSVKKAKLPSYSVSVPTISITTNHEDLNKACEQAFYDLQDSIIRERVEEIIASSNTSGSITNHEINPTAASIYFDKVQSSGRLSAESIKAWYQESIAETLATALQEANSKLAADPELLKKALDQHEKFLVQLASPRANMSPALATQLLKAVSLATEDSTIKSGLTKKLEIFTKPPEEVTLLGL